MSEGIVPTVHRYPHVVRAVLSTPWAIQEEKLLAILEVVELRASGWKFDHEAIEARVEAAGGGKQPPNRSTGMTAVIPIFGVIQQRMDSMSRMSGGTSCQAISQAFRAAMQDDRIKSVILEVDSPGGGVYGIAELAQEIFDARGTKPVTAIANSLAASAAYWIASQADELVVTPSGQVGSIGVYGVHEDISGQLEQAGVKPTLVSAGKFKVEANPYEPLSAEARDHMQAQVDEYYGMFVDAVARGRETNAGAVRSGFGEGRVVNAKEAVRMGMADRVATMDQVIQRHGGMQGAMQMARAESDDERRLRAARLADIAMANHRTARLAGAGGE